MMATFVKPARFVNTVWLHCSAASNPDITAADIDRWHRERGWSGIGYHYFCRTDGTMEIGRDIEKTGAHVKGHNTGSIGICLNGLHLSDFTDAQFNALYELCEQINTAYAGAIRFRGHNEVAAKACPVYVPREVLPLDELGMWTEDVTDPDEEEEPEVVLPPEDGVLYRFRRIEQLANEQGSYEDIAMHARVGANLYIDEQQ